MSNDTGKKTAEPETGKNTRAPVQRKTGARFILVLGFFLLLALGASAYFAHKEWQKFAEHEHAELTGLASQTVALKKNIAALQAQQAGLMNSVNALIDAQASLQKNMANLDQGQNNTGQEWALAEVEYLLLLATHRLLFEADIHTALAAMQAADNRLKNLPDPALLAVRKQVLADMNALRSIRAVDISGLALYLADLLARTDNLPLKEPEIKTQQTVTTVEAPEDTTQPWWRRLSSSVWRELKGVIIISHDGERAELSPLPQQSFYLRQNLRLQLETARYAVLRRDTELLHSSVETIKVWLRSYFAVSNNSVSNIIESLSQMQSLDLAPPIPAISSSLETLRAYMQTGNVGSEEWEGHEEIQQ